jgi:hypothetical protein
VPRPDGVYAASRSHLVGDRGSRAARVGEANLLKDFSIVKSWPLLCTSCLGRPQHLVAVSPIHATGHRVRLSRPSDLAEERQEGRSLACVPRTGLRPQFGCNYSDTIEDSERGWSIGVVGEDHIAGSIGEPATTEQSNLHDVQGGKGALKFGIAAGLVSGTRRLDDYYHGQTPS